MLGNGPSLRMLLLYTDSGRAAGGRSNGRSDSSESFRKWGWLWRVLSQAKENKDDLCCRAAAEGEEDEPSATRPIDDLLSSADSRLL